MIRTGAVAAAGIIRAIGLKNKLRKKNTLVVIAVSPVLPPAPTPAADSTNVVIVVVPNIAPTTVPSASTVNGFCISGKSPFSSRSPAFQKLPIVFPV